MSNENRYSGSPHRIWLSYEGAATDQNLIGLYDLSRSLLGFERSLAITTHFVLQNEIITQVTALRGAQILCSVPEAGSYKIPAYISAIGITVYSLGSLEATNPLGHIVFSLYELAVMEATGQKVDYDLTLQEIYEKALREGSGGLIMPKRSQVESLVEKIEPAISDLHRPMVASETALRLKISDEFPESKDEEPILLNAVSFDKLRFRRRSDDIVTITGKVSSFNMNTFNGRIFVPNLKRPVSFFLSHAGRSVDGVKIIGESFARNIANSNDEDSLVSLDVIVTHSRTGRPTRFLVVKVQWAK